MGIAYIDSEVMTEFGHSIRLEFPATVSKKDIWNLPFMQSFKSSCTGGNGIRTKHQDAIDIKRECIIESRINGMEIPFAKLQRAECITTVR